MTGAAPGRFIAPHPALADCADPAAALGIVIRSGYRAIDESSRLAGASRIFDTLMAAAAKFDLPHEDQCSA